MPADETVALWLDVTGGQRLACEQGPQSAEVVGEDLTPFIEGRPERGERPRIAARTEPDLEATLGEHVEDRGVLGHAHPVLHRQGDDGRAQPDPRGPRRGMREEDERGGQATLGRREMVLGDPGGGEPEPLGRLDLLEREPVPLVRGGVLEEPGEESEPRARGEGGSDGLSHGGSQLSAAAKVPVG